MFATTPMAPSIVRAETVIPRMDQNATVRLCVVLLLHNPSGWLVLGDSKFDPD